MIETADNTLWLCTNKGLMKWQRGEVISGGIAILDQPEVNIFTAVAFDSTTYLMATNIGMFKVDFKRKQAVKLNDFRSMVIGKWRNQFWIESSEDVRLLGSDGITTTLLFKKDSNDSSQFPDTEVKCFYSDAAGILWIGTWGRGLILYDDINKRFQIFAEAEGLPNAVIYGILEDASGNLWLSTNKGICVFDTKQRKVIRNFEKADGLQSNEFNTNAYFKSPAGNFYFGGINGLTYYQPFEASAIKSSIPKSIVTGFFINQTRVDSLRDGTVISQYGDQHIELAWGEQNFGFEVAGLGFNFPGRTRLKYQLENFDADWSFVEDETRISYTNVPPGKYTLRALASNSFGDWEVDGLTIQITVNGSFWKSSYFLLALIVGSLAFLILIYYWRVSSLKRRSIYLEKLVALRTLEIQKMNEEIATQNEEISAQNEELSTQTEALAVQNQELISIRSSLEKKVRGRTLILENVNNKLIEQNVQLEQFSFITAHNIRGPLARIKGLIQLLPQKDLLEIEHLKKSVQNLDDIISDLGTIINIRDGASRLIEPVSLQRALEHTIKTLEIDIKDKKMIIDQSEFQDYVIRGIEPYVVSIFHNLLHNALKYSANLRQPIIKISTHKTNEEVTVTIANNGIGIDMRYAEGKIFNLYQRFHANSEGKGFGLFLSKTQMEAMGGQIQVASELGKVSTFTLVFRGV
jgi:signal transduction histidine kinase